MAICVSISAHAKCIVHAGGSIGRQMLVRSYAVSGSPSNSCCYVFHSSQFSQRYAHVTVCRNFSCSSSIGFPASEGGCFSSVFSKKLRSRHPFMTKGLLSSTGHQTTCIGLSSRGHNMSLRLTGPNYKGISMICSNVKSESWLLGRASRGLVFATCICYCGSEKVHAEASISNNDENDECGSASAISHGKKVYTKYSVTGIPGDGSCLFRSIVHGACLRSGKPPPSENLQKELADELRARVADEYVKRREETEWFVEGDFDTYVSQIRKPHVWGGEPELFMASHVLQMPITVYMHDEDSGGLISIAEYGQEYDKENPIRVIYYGFGHYDALQIPGQRDVKSRL